jgi:thiol-disulfide isomerase/thioredoxin
MANKFTIMIFAVLLLAGFLGARTSKDKLPSFTGATQWLNTPPLKDADLKGKVILVEFWTYTCINWRRTLPYVRTWAEKYRQQGFVVIGVHTPEFSFEKETGNVQWAIKDMNIGFPVAMDNNYGVWNAFHNEYWPAMYFIDAKGTIRHHQFGEGNYDQSERVIQQLLAEAGANVDKQLSPVEPMGAELAGDWKTLQSPENYINSERSSGFASLGGVAEDRPHKYLAPSGLTLNQWALSGNWTLGREAATVNENDGRLIYRFHARDVNLIMGPAKPGAKVPFRMLVDGKPPAGAHGLDIDDQGNGTIDGQRMYQLIRQSGPITDHDFSIEFPSAGAEVFDFTFG